jgi:hypothetical protein
MELGELRGETVSKIAGDVLDEYRRAWAVEIAKWKVARRREAEIEKQITELRLDRAAEGPHAYTGQSRRTR